MFKKKDKAILWSASDENTTIVWYYYLDDADLTYISFIPKRKFNKNNFSSLEDQITLDSVTTNHLTYISQQLLNVSDCKGIIQADKYKIIFDDSFSCRCVGLCSMISFRLFETGEVWIQRYQIKSDLRPHEVILSIKDIKNLNNAIEKRKLYK